MRNIACQIETNNENKEFNNDTCYGYYLYSIYPENVDICWYYFDISNNEEIPEDKLNYQTIKKHNFKFYKSYLL